MRITRPILEWYCETCEEEREFKYYSSNVAICGRPEQHFYSCVSGCGRAYEQDKMLSLENALKLYNNITTEE